MKRGALLAASLGASIVATAIADRPARAAGSIVAPGVVTTDARMAIAVSGERTTTWSSLHVDGAAGTFAMVVPTLDGSEIDTSSRAFFEALEDATAPRVVPPNQAPAACPGKTPTAVLSVEGDVKGSPALEPVEVVVMATGADVEAWATARGLSVDPAFSQALAGFGASYRFVVARFQAPGGPAVTKTLRLVSPTPDPTLPLALSFAGNQDLRVTTWELGPGRSRIGGTEVMLTTESLAFKVSNETSNYASLRDAILSDPSRHLVELAGHDALVASTSLFDGAQSIDSVIESYYRRASSYGDASSDPSGCTFQAATMLAQAATIGHACPRADLGLAGTGAPCVESTTPIGLDPAKLRCGGTADDLAVGLSDLVASGAWITRSVLRVAPTKVAANVTVGFGADPGVSAVREAKSIDQSGCGGSSSSSSSSSSTGGSTGVPVTTGTGAAGATHIKVPVYQHEGCGCGGTYALVGYDDVDTSTDPSPPAAYYDNTGDSCSSSTASTDPGTGYDTTATDSCASDPGSSSSSDAASCDSGSSGSSSSGDACGGGSGSSSDSCSSGGSSGDSCGGGSGSDSSCAVAGGPHGGRHLRVRLSAAVYALALVIAPLRRWRRRPRATKRSRSKNP